MQALFLVYFYLFARFIAFALFPLDFSKLFSEKKSVKSRWPYIFIFSIVSKILVIQTFCKHIASTTSFVHTLSLAFDNTTFSCILQENANQFIAAMPSLSRYVIKFFYDIFSQTYREGFISIISLAFFWYNY